LKVTGTLLRASKRFDFLDLFTFFRKAFYGPVRKPAGYPKSSQSNDRIGSERRQSRPSGSLDLDGHTLQSAPDMDQKLLICSASANGQFRWAIGDNGRALSRAGRVVTADDGRIFVAGDVQCFWRGTRICEPGQLDSFALPPPGDGTWDLFLARLDAATASAVQLSFRISGSKITLSWPTSADGFVLESSGQTGASTWSLVDEPPSTEGDQTNVSVSLEGDARFFRLRKP